MTKLCERFRGFAPVVVDVETGGFDKDIHALLEIACVPLLMEDGSLVRGETWHRHVLPYDGSVCDPQALAFTGIDPFHPFRRACPEDEAMMALSKWMKAHIKAQRCTRVVLVGHNAHFDLGFVLAALDRHQIKCPLHRFSCFDTATMGGVFYGETVLAQIARQAGRDYDAQAAHSAIYDAELTADLFCQMLALVPKT